MNRLRASVAGVVMSVALVVAAAPATPASAARCPDRLLAAALRAGWRLDELPTVDYLMWRESRCTPWAVSSTDDHGLMQVNARHLSTPGYAMLCARTEGRICEREDMRTVRGGLRAARVLANVARSWGWSQWQPWGL